MPGSISVVVLRRCAMRHRPRPAGAPQGRCYPARMRVRELVLTGAVLCACDPQIRSERGDFTLVFPGLQARHAGWPTPHLLAAGSRVCPELRH